MTTSSNLVVTAPAFLQPPDLGERVTEIAMKESRGIVSGIGEGGNAGRILQSGLNGVLERVLKEVLEGCWKG